MEPTVEKKRKPYSPFDPVSYPPIDFSKKHDPLPRKDTFAIRNTPKKTKRVIPEAKPITESKCEYIDKGQTDPKQILLNFLEGLHATDFTFKLETTHCDMFYTAIVAWAPGFVINQIVNEAPKGIMYHINPENNKFEVFINKS